MLDIENDESIILSMVGYIKLNFLNKNKIGKGVRVVKSYQGFDVSYQTALLSSLFILGECNA